MVWAGFAGNVLDVTATFDAAGKLIKEVGYRAPEMNVPVTELLLPLPAQSATAQSASAQSASAQAAAQASAPQNASDNPVIVPSLAPGITAPGATSSVSSRLREGLEKVYGDQQATGQSGQKPQQENPPGKDF